MRTFVFREDDAAKYGVNAAVILANLRHWVKENKANNRNIHDGVVWTYNSTRAFSEIFPFFTEKQIKTALKKLRDEGVLLTASYNKSSFDRTLWYSVADPEYCLPSVSPPLDLSAQSVVPPGTDNTRYKPNINTSSIDLLKDRDKVKETTEVEKILPKVAIDTVATDKQEVRVLVKSTEGISFADYDNATHKQLLTAYNIPDRK